MIIKYKSYVGITVEEKIAGIEIIVDPDGVYMKCLRTQSNPWYIENDPYLEVIASKVFSINP